MARFLVSLVGCSLAIVFLTGGLAGAGSRKPRPAQERPVVVEVRGSGFHAGDAAIGAAAAMSLVFVVAGAVLYIGPSVGRRRS